MDILIIKHPGQRVRYGCPYCGRKFNWMHKADEHLLKCEYFLRRISNPDDLTRLRAKSRKAASQVRRAA